MRIDNLPKIEVANPSSHSAARHSAAAGRPAGAQRAAAGHSAVGRTADAGRTAAVPRVAADRPAAGRSATGRPADAGRTAGFKSVYNQPTGNWRSPAAQPAAPSAFQGQAWYEASAVTPAPEPQRRIQKKHVIVAACVVALAGAGVAIAAALGAFGSKDSVEVPVAGAPTVQASVKVDNVLIPHRELSRGQALENVRVATELTGSYAGEYYFAELAGTPVYIEKKYVRTSTEKAPEAWVGYAAEDAAVFAKPDFSGQPVQKLQLNDEVTVLDSFGDMLFVSTADGLEGYMPADKLMRQKAEEAAEEAADGEAGEAAQDASVYSSAAGSSGGTTWSGPSGNTGSAGSASGSGFGSSAPSGGSSNNGAGTGGSGNGGSSGGSGSGDASSGGSNSGGSPIDGDELLMPTSGSFSVGELLLGTEVAYAAEAPSAAEKSDPAQEKLPASGIDGTVLMDGTPSYLAILNRGDEVTVKIDSLFDFEGVLVVGRTDETPEANSTFADDLTVSDKAVPGGSPAAAGEASAQEGADEASDLCTVLVNEQEVQLPEMILRLEGQADYDPWTGFAKEGAVLFADYKLTMNPMGLELNQELKIIDAVGTKILVVDVDGAAYCIDASFASKERIEEPKPEEAADDSDAGSSVAGQSGSYSSSQYGSGGNWGGGSWGDSDNGGWSGGSSAGGSGGSSGGGSSDGSSGGSSGGDSSGGAGGSDGAADADNSEVWTAPKL